MFKIKNFIVLIFIVGLFYWSGNAGVAAVACDPIPFSVTNINGASIYFGIVAVGDKKEVNVNVRNDSDSSLIIDARVTGDNSFRGNQAYLIASKQSKDFTIVFRPNSPGKKIGDLIFSTNECPGKNTLFTLIGGEEGDIFVVPKNYDFGEVKIGEQSAKNMEIINNKSFEIIADYNISSGDFSIKKTKEELGPGQKREVEVIFKPQTEGSLIATLQISFSKKADGSHLSTTSVSLKGKGLVDKNITVSPTSHDFGKREVGTSVDQDFIVSIPIIPGGGKITYTLSGNLGDFTLEPPSGTVREFDGLNEILEAVKVTFKPIIEGQKSAILNIKVVDSNGSEIFSQDISIKGGEGGPQPPPPSDGSGDGETIHINYPNPIGEPVMTVTDLVRNIINGIFGLLGAVAVAMIVYGGTRYLTAAGNEKNVEKAKSILTSAIVGLVITLLSLAIVDLLFVLLAG